MNRVANIALQNLTLANLQALQGRIAERSVQVSTGKVGQRFSDMPTESRRLLNLESAHGRMSQYVKNIDLVGQRLTTMETNVRQIMDIASKFKTTLINALNNDNGQALALNAEAQTMLEQISSLLNVQEGDRYLFSGSMTNTAPVDLNDPGFLAPPPAIPSSADTNYYQGDSTQLSFRADESLNVTYGVTADQSGFEKVIRSLHLVSTAVTAPVMDGPRINEALRVIDEAIAELPLIVSRIGVTQSTLDTTRKAHDNALLYTEQNISDLENVDIAEAFTQLSADQTTLEASFSIIAQMRSVSLLNFL